MTRWSRFAGVGALGFAVQLATLHLLTSLLHLPPVVSVILAVETAILHNFGWHERWTWRDRVVESSRAATFERLLRFHAASGAVSLLGNVAFTAVLVAAHLPLLIANGIAVGSLTAVNYLVTDRLAYGVTPTMAASRDRLTSRRAMLRRSFFVWIAIAVAAGSGPAIHAAELTQETIAAWTRYVAGVESRRAAEARDANRFLAIDFESDTSRPEALARLRRGDILVRNVAGGTVDVGDGTISHWRGQVYVPGVTVNDVVENAALRGRASAHRQEDVLESRVLGRGADSLQLFLKLQRHAIVTVAYNTEHTVSFERFGADRAASRSVSTRIAELRDAGTAAEAEKPVGQDRGFLWRLHSYWRYQSAPGGVIVELESLTLSRDIPWAIRVMAGPIIDRIARESMTRTLASLRGRFSGATAD